MLDVLGATAAELEVRVRRMKPSSAGVHPAGVDRSVHTAEPVSVAAPRRCLCGLTRDGRHLWHSDQEAASIYAIDKQIMHDSAVVPMLFAHRLHSYRLPNWLPYPVLNGDLTNVWLCDR